MGNSCILSVYLCFTEKNIFCSTIYPSYPILHFFPPPPPTLTPLSFLCPAKFSPLLLLLCCPKLSYAMLYPANAISQACYAMPPSSSPTTRPRSHSRTVSSSLLLFFSFSKLPFSSFSLLLLKVVSPPTLPRYYMTAVRTCIRRYIFKAAYL